MLRPGGFFAAAARKTRLQPGFAGAAMQPVSRELAPFKRSRVFSLSVDCRAFPCRPPWDRSQALPRSMRVACAGAVVSLGASAPVEIVQSTRTPGGADIILLLATPPSPTPTLWYADAPP